MKRSEIKRRAREQIKGNIGMLFLVSLIISIITSATWFFIAGIILAGPFSLSTAYIYRKISKGEDIEITDTFKGFDDFASAIATYILKSIYTFFWSLLFIVPGIIKSYSYSMTMYILLDNPDMPANEAITESRKMMKGNKFRFFVQQLSFLGWQILSVLTFGILYFIWVGPYMESAAYNFYLDVSGKISQEQNGPEIQVEPIK